MHRSPFQTTFETPWPQFLSSQVHEMSVSSSWTHWLVPPQLLSTQDPSESQLAYAPGCPATKQHSWSPSLSHVWLKRAQHDIAETEGMREASAARVLSWTNVRVKCMIDISIRGVSIVCQGYLKGRNRGQYLYESGVGLRGILRIWVVWQWPCNIFVSTLHSVRMGQVTNLGNSETVGGAYLVIL